MPVFVGVQLYTDATQSKAVNAVYFMRCSVLWMRWWWYRTHVVHVEGGKMELKNAEVDSANVRHGDGKVNDVNAMT
jgi:hypothetical protein